MRETIPTNLRQSVLQRDKHTCRYCGSRQEPFHLDHVYPVIKGGETTYDNLVTACVQCNSRKHASVGIWPKPVGYFVKNKTVSKGITIVMILYILVGLYVVKNLNFDTLITIPIFIILIIIPYILSFIWESDFYDHRR